MRHAIFSLIGVLSLNLLGGCGGFTFCLRDADCADGLYCNGWEICLAGSCVAGVSPCGTQEFDLCIEEEDTCVDVCAHDLDCDDGEPCSVERCDECGLCQQEPRCPGECDEESGRCSNPCVTGADCPDDGLFCNGPEICTEGSCVSWGNPCGEPVDDCDYCLEVVDSCALPCSTPAECDDGNPCTVDSCEECGTCRNEPACPGDCDDQTGQCVD